MVYSEWLPSHVMGVAAPRQVLNSGCQGRADVHGPCMHLASDTALMTWLFLKKNGPQAGRQQGMQDGNKRVCCGLRSRLTQDL